MTPPAEIAPPPAPARGAPARGVAAALAAVLLLAAALRLHELGAQATWADELYRLVWSKGYELDRWFDVLPGETGARLPPRDAGAALRVANAHTPPLYGVVLNLWLRAVGSESDLAARLPSALLGLLSVVGAFLAARQLLGARVALWTAALVGLSPLHVLYAQEVNHYTLVACLVAFSLFFHVRWLARPSWASGAGLALTGLGALYAHYFAGLALACQALAVALHHRRDPRRLALGLAPYAVVAAAFAPYLPTLLRQVREITHPSMVGTFRGAGHLAERLQAIAVAPWLGERGEHLAPLAGVPVAALSVALFVVGIRAVRDGAARRLLLVNAVGPLVGVVALFFILKSNSVVWTRYQLVFTFAQLVPVAAALEAGRRWRWAAAGALAALAAVGFRFLFVDLVKEDWKGAVAAISARASPHDAIAVYRPDMAYALARYLPSEHRLFGLQGGEHLPLLVDVAAEGRNATWFVSAWGEGSDVPAAVHALLACRYARREDYPLAPGRVVLTVTRYGEPRGADAPVAAASLARCGAAAEAVAWERAAEGPLHEAAWVDAPAPGEALAAASALTVSGWAFSSRGIRSLLLEVDGEERRRTRHLGFLRPDVAAAYPAAPPAHALHSGFSATVDLSGLPPGAHALAVTAVREDGSTSRLASREFRLAAPAPPR